MDATRTAGPETVPQGLYCHAVTGPMEACGFWGTDPASARGYCHLLGRGDAEAEAGAGDCRLLWSSARPGAVGQSMAGLAGRPAVGTLSVMGKECGLRSGLPSGPHTLRLPGRGLLRTYDEGILLGETALGTP